MIKYETIISNFDDKVTLYNWLCKVEEALKNASATNFVVNKKGNATLSFSITFADGTTLESGDIVLQQGESVNEARIASGILQLHLTNGTWLTAGNVKPVSNFEIDASQHLIVNYADGTSEDLGAIFNGNVNIAGNFTADSIIENMTGYTFSKGSIASSVTLDYAGVVKNGNKITFVIAGTMINNSTFSARIGDFYMPSSIGEKLYPINEDNDVSVSQVFMAKVSGSGAGVAKSASIRKPSNTHLIAYIYGATDLEADKTYAFRYEQTFLLSDNLAQ